MKIELAGHYGYRRLLRSAVPSMLMMIIGSMYSIIDGLFVSNCVGLTPFAALNIIWPAIMVVGAMGLMIGTGGSAIISMLLGQRNLEKANETFTSLVVFTIILAVLFATPMFIFMPQIAELLGANTPELLHNGVIYGRICAAGMPAFMLQMAFQSFFMAAEKPELGTKLSLASGLTNISFDAIFILGFGWGLAGAALATVLGFCTTAFFAIWYFTKKRKANELRFTRVKFDRHILIHTCTNGSSEYIGNIAFCILSMCYNLQLIKLYGEAGVAAYSVIMYIGYVFSAIFIGYNLTVTPVIGFNYGAGNREELKSLLNKSIHLTLGIGLCFVVIAQLIAKPAALLFVSDNPFAIELTTKAQRIYMLSFLIAGVNMFTSAWFTGLGNGYISAVAAFCRSLVFELGAVFLIPALFGADSIWFSVIIAEACTLCLCIFLLHKFRLERYL